ncbi:hypothetical protein HJC99_00220 [Candidatus Saccharibacteria bacterium]|nr:hypothetical protein [Candidatus Saccharibacteria bacterium]
MVTIFSSVGAFAGAMIAIIIVAAFLVWFGKVGYRVEVSGHRMLTHDLRPEVFAVAALGLFALIGDIVVGFTRTGSPYTYVIPIISGALAATIVYKLSDIHYRKYAGMDEDHTDEAGILVKAKPDYVIRANQRDDIRALFVWPTLFVVLAAAAGWGFYTYCPLPAGWLANHRMLLTPIAAIGAGLVLTWIIRRVVEQLSIRRSYKIVRVVESEEANADEASRAAHAATFLKRNTPRAPGNDGKIVPTAASASPSSLPSVALARHILANCENGKYILLGLCLGKPGGDLLLETVGIKPKTIG